MTFIRVVRFYLENGLCQSLETFTGGPVTFVNSRHHRFAQCLSREGLGMCLFLTNFMSGMTREPAEAGWQMPRWRRSADLRAPGVSMNRDVVLGTPEWVSAWCRQLVEAFCSAELDACHRFSAWIQSWGLNFICQGDFLFIKSLQLTRSDFEIACSSP